MSWKNISIAGIDQITKCVGEFEVSAMPFFEEIYQDGFIHYGAFKVKIYEDQINEYYTGYTNLRLSTTEGGYEGGIGFGKTLDEALQDTIQNFINNVAMRRKVKQTNLILEDFVLLGYDEY